MARNVFGFATPAAAVDLTKGQRAGGEMLPLVTRDELAAALN